MLDLLIVKFN